MSAQCPWCRGHDLQAGADLNQCLNCGQHSTPDGKKTVPSSVSNEGGTVKSVEKELS